MNYGDHILYDLAVKAGATYGDHLVKVSVEYHEASTLDAWGMEIWTRFEVSAAEGGTRLHFLPGHPSTLMSNALHESITTPVEW